MDFVSQVMTPGVGAILDLNTLKYNACAMCGLIHRICNSSESINAFIHLEEQAAYWLHLISKIRRNNFSQIRICLRQANDSKIQSINKIMVWILFHKS